VWLEVGSVKMALSRPAHQRVTHTVGLPIRRIVVIYLVGGAPRAGKSILGQQVAANMKIGWVSTDLLYTILRMTDVKGIKTEWNATPEAITANAEWFFPYLERFVWGVASLAENYLIEGVDFLPAQVKQLSTQYQLQVVFLGCSKMTLEHFDQFPGHSRGYSDLPEELRRQFAKDVPLWSEFIRQECESFGYPYIDTVKDFPQQLALAESILTASL
jgi:2-phosphoglycerate kinase